MLDVENSLFAWRSLHDGLCAAQSELRKARSCNVGGTGLVARLEAKVWRLQCKSDEAFAALNAAFSRHQEARYAAKVASGKKAASDHDSRAAAPPY